MSFHYYSIYGYGIDFSEFEQGWKDKAVSEKLDLLKVYLDNNAPETGRKFFDFVSKVNADCETADWDDYMEFDEDYHLGLATIITMALFEKHHIHFTSCDDFNGNIYIVYEPPFPWNIILPEERELTREKLNNMFNELTVNLFDRGCNGEFLSVENGG